MDLVGAAIGLIPMVLSLSVHEFAHAWSANRLGDDTAERQGRLTLNPLAHIDPFGTILLPLILVLSHVPAFGWARPVPIDPTRFRRGVSMGKGMALTASAGPLSNLVLALLGTLALGASYRLGFGDAGAGDLLRMVILLNVVLALFNLIPVPPLDGSRVVAWLLPTRLQGAWHTVERFAPVLLIVILMFGGRVIRGPVYAVVDLLNRLLNAIV
ncbi:MAG TPA: site-2 protease family protein [Anaeromyxobacteraceae bacterium]|nr:site-2 protease family protein [Anaeromyxobacteraceae bacterium]